MPRSFGTTNLDTRSTPPTPGPLGSVYYDTSTFKLMISDGVAWYEHSTISAWEDIGLLGATYTFIGNGLSEIRYAGLVNSATTTITVSLDEGERIRVRLAKDRAGPIQVNWIGVPAWYTPDGLAPVIDNITELEFEKVLGVIWGRVLGVGLYPDASMAVHGTWAVVEVHGASGVTNATAAINRALTFTNMKGLCVRFGWLDLWDGTTFDPNGLLDQACALALAKGVQFAPRFMCGQWTHNNILTDTNVGTYLDKTGTYGACSVTAGPTSPANSTITRAAGFPANLVGTTVTSGFINGTVTSRPTSTTIVISNPAASSSANFTLSVNNDPNVAGILIPTPFMPDGSPNLGFEDYYSRFMTKYFAWARSKTNVPLVHGAWYSHDYSELYHSAPIRALPGYSPSSFVLGHTRLWDIAYDLCGYDVQLEYPLSGSGPISGPTGVATLIAQHMQSKAGDNSPFIFFQGNGWGGLAAGAAVNIYSTAGPDTYVLDATAPNNIVIWGNSATTTEDQFDSVMNLPIRRSFQAIQPDDYNNWIDMFARAIAAGATYLEIYTASFAATNNATNLTNLQNQINAFA